MKKSFYSRYGLAALVVALFLLPIVVLGARKAMQTNANDVRTWLSKEYKETDDYRWFQDHFGTEEFILVTWDGCTLDDERLTIFAKRLRPPVEQSGADERRALFAEVITGPQLLARLTEDPIDLPRAQAIQRLQGKLIGPDGEQTCAVITPADGFKDHLHDMLDLIRRIAVEEAAVPADALRMGGPPVINAAVDSEGESSLRMLALLSGAMGLGIAWFCFRSLKLTLIVFFTGAYSATIGVAVVWFGGGTMNAILMTMPPLVYVAAMSGAIHLANYYREALGEAGPLRAPGRAVAHARVPLLLATSTTAIGLLSLCYSELQPIKDFGVFSAIGVVGSGLLLFFFLPSCLQLSPLRAKDALADGQAHHDDGLLTLSRRWRLFAQSVVRRRHWVAAACLLLVALCAAGLPRMQTTIKVEKFFARDAKILQDYRWLEDRVGALVPMELVLRMPKESELTMLERMRLVKQVQDSVEKIDEVGSTTSTATFSRPLKPKWPMTADMLDRRLVANRDEFLKAPYLRETDDEELWRISLRVVANNDVDYGAFVQDIRGKVEPVLAEARQTDPRAAGIEAVYTGMVPVVYKAQRSLLDGLLFGFGTDLALIIVAIAVLLRHWSAGLIITITSLFPAVVVLGIMSWAGVVVDIGTVLTPSIALGVSVDDVVHFLLWFRRGIAERGMDRRQAVMLAYEGCAKPMYQSWGVIGLGLSVFALSNFTPTFRFGAMMIALLSAGLVCNLLFLPSLLAGPLGAIYEWSLKRRLARHAAGEECVKPPHPVPHPASEPVLRPTRRSVKT